MNRAMIRLAERVSPAVVQVQVTGFRPAGSNRRSCDDAARRLFEAKVVFSESGGSQGPGFAIPARVAKLVHESLRRYGQVPFVELGIAAEAITPVPVVLATVSTGVAALVF
jgi:S1-C subfamily serine protease